MKYLIVILGILLSTSCLAADWDKTDKILFGSFLVFETADYLQTKQLLDTPGLHEHNPFLKDNKKYVTPYFAGCVLTGYLIADYLSPPKRKAFLIALNMLEVGMVGNNYKLGIRLKF